MECNPIYADFERDLMGYCDKLQELTRSNYPEREDQSNPPDISHPPHMWMMFSIRMGLEKQILSIKLYQSYMDKTQSLPI